VNVPDRAAHLPDLAGLLGPYLARQDWAQSALGSFGESSVPVDIVDVQVLRSDHPGLASMIVTSRQCTFHLVLGWRPIAFAPGRLSGRLGAVLGSAHDALGEEVLVYDALADEELVRLLLEAATGGCETARRARLVGSLVSHASLIFDDRLFMKCYRVIELGRRPEIELMTKLDRTGFNHMLAPVAHWERGGRDLGLVREFVPGAIEGKALAETSLRDLLARADKSADGASFEDVGLAGGDFGPEMRRIGVMSARMHLALGEAYGGAPLGAEGQTSGRGGESAHRSDAAGPQADALPVAEQEPGWGGVAIRIHGDYHLRRVMRTDAGWLVAGFGDDPLMGADAGSGSQRAPRYASALEDIADICCSLRQVAFDCLDLQPPSTAAHAELLAAGWESRNIGEFIRGYLSTEGVGRFVPAAREDFDELLASLITARS
jgi:maltokinase